MCFLGFLSPLCRFLTRFVAFLCPDSTSDSFFMPSSRGLFQKNMYFCIIFILTYNQSIQTMNKIKLFFCAILAAVVSMACNSTTGSIVGGTSGSIVGGILGSQISNNPLGSIVGSVAGSYGGSVVGSSIGSGKAFKKKNKKNQQQTDAPAESQTQEVQTQPQSQSQSDELYQ